MSNHETSGGLAISAGDANDAEIFGGVVIFGGGDNGLRPVVGKNGLIIKRELLKKLFHGSIITRKVG